MILKFKNRKIEINNFKQVGFFGRFIGLMFKSRNTSPLLFKFNKNVSLPIHSFFVFFPFIAIWTDDKFNVLERRIVHPFSLSVLPTTYFRNLIEIPLNDITLKEFSSLVGERKI